MNSITTHVLDIARGRPAAGVPIILERRDANGAWQLVGKGATDDDGRLRTLVPADRALETGVYKITFDTERYYSPQNITGFYPEASVTFHVRDASQHYHVPLLLSPYGFSTYRGS